MSEVRRVGVIICHRYHTCAGGKCLRALRNREGAFKLYRGQAIELVGYTTCDGCPGGNVEYAPEEMARNGAEAIHLATGLVVGYPPCPYIDDFCKFIRRRYGLQAVVGTHPIPQKYYLNHTAFGTWDGPAWQERLRHLDDDEVTRLAYD